MLVCPWGSGGCLAWCAGKVGKCGAWILPACGRDGLAVGDEWPYRGEGWTTLPCPTGQGALRKCGATLLAPVGQGRSGRARAGLGYGVLVGNGSLVWARIPAFGARERWTGRVASLVSAQFAMRRGYGGLRPHPLKGQRPLRIPLAAAQNAWPHNESRAAPAQRLFDVWMD